MSKTIFISYSHKDVAAVEQIVQTIERTMSCSVWFDHKLKGGEEYFSVIAEQILQCDCFIFVVSPHSVTSNFCIRELEFAMSENRRIVAVWLEDFTPPPRVRLVISNTHYIRPNTLTDRDLSQSIAEALEAEHLVLGDGEGEYILSEQKTDSEKYFLSPDEKARIHQLMEKEKREDYLACFEPDAAILLGMAYELGVGTATDEDRAAFYYHVAAYKGNPDGEYLELALQLSRGVADKAAAIRRMRELAEAGSLKALVYWGDELYYGNWGMTADMPTAYQWWKRAADMGDPVAKYFLAYGYRLGEIGTVDYTLALMYFLEAAAQHFPRAYRQIAIMHRKGQLLEKDEDKAREYYQRAIDNGDGLAVNYIGNMEYSQKNYEAAFACYSQAVDYAIRKKLPNGNPYYNLGWAYEYGQGTPKDPRKAVELYLTAASHKHKSSAKRVAHIIYHEIGDLAEKRELLEKAAELNCTHAEYWLAKTYESSSAKSSDDLFDNEDDDSPKQTEQALALYERGADKGDLYCIESCLDYYSWVRDAKTFADRHKALQYYQLYFSLFDLPDNEDFRKERQGTLHLQGIYYTYAVELSVDKEHYNPDKQLALYYYKKCLDCPQGAAHWSKITMVADYIAKGGGLFERDLPYAQELAALCYNDLDKLIAFAKENNKSLSTLAQHLITCYDRLIRESKDKKIVAACVQHKNEVLMRIADA